jgi:hypothetical protein
MMISEEQVRGAIDYMRTHEKTATGDAHGGPAVSDELFQRVKNAMNEVPEIRSDRVAEARALVKAEAITSREVADQMLARFITDALR